MTRQMGAAQAASPLLRRLVVGPRPVTAQALADALLRTAPAMCTHVQRNERAEGRRVLHSAPGLSRFPSRQLAVLFLA